MKGPYGKGKKNKSKFKMKKLKYTARHQDLLGARDKGRGHRNEISDRELTRDLTVSSASDP